MATKFGVILQCSVYVAGFMAISRLWQPVTQPTDGPIAFDCPPAPLKLLKLLKLSVCQPIAIGRSRWT